MCFNLVSREAVGWVTGGKYVVVCYHIAIGGYYEARAKPLRLTGDRLSAAPELAEKLVKRRAGREAGKAVHLYFLRGGYVHHRRLKPSRQIGKAHGRAGAGRCGADRARLILGGLGAHRLLERQGGGSAAGKKRCSYSI